MSTTLSRDTFVDTWLDAWNNHDLERILAHYRQDVVFSSPLVASLVGEASGVLLGRKSLRPYFAAALARFPGLHFKLRHVLTGVRSVVLEYETLDGVLAAEVMQLDEQGRIAQVQCHYLCS